MGAEASAKAQSVIDTLYGYKTGPVLFKPTKAAEKPFRLDPAAALSYFVSGNTAFPEDKGFALKPWTGVRFENNGVLLEGTTALAQGNYFFTDTDGKETKVEYTFGYFRDSQGQLRINLHHSPLEGNELNTHVGLWAKRILARAGHGRRNPQGGR